MNRIPAVSRLLTAAAVAAVLLVPSAVSAQGSGADEGVRVGVTFGGISTVGFVVEYFDGARSLELGVGTWSFRDLSASLVVKEYFGTGALRPFLGAGLWLVGAAPVREGEQIGLAAILHAPIGVDWRAVSDHYVGGSLDINRALWVRRTDPEDDFPLNRRLVPLPGVYYRWGR